MPMRFVITAGGTTEPIDPVRKITNSASGQLGSLVAQRLVARAGEKIEAIHYVCERGSVVPKLDCVDLVEVRGVAQAEEALRDLLSRRPVDGVIHSMAVSDYAVSGVTSVHEIGVALSRLVDRWSSQGMPDESGRDEALVSVLAGASRPPSENEKMSSGIDDLVLLMRRTPKLIGMIKKLQPRTVLVGFKLLNRVSEEELLHVAASLKQANDCDFVLANDLATIGEGRHRGFLVGPDAGVARFETKAQIADGIAAAVIDRIEERLR
ncbi:phosphopantothenate-cysteine ligase [Propionibacterium cyclohexanicum]|uniref:Phosphopantothenate-cysteine ligase n=1 Tax=Propionibacterium cyclohexanicum TaxID=64702 RepID=A0A1H9TSZ3_9ACTN|nr:phosphopantothenoylcysteine decarboxylase [Propionibacterium cyclohexanicum]SER99813.1 phosphopantothenate-cysteine ligase [Propionibacterium cyclohexanicum]